MSHRPIPPRWLHCPRKSQLIANKFVAFKTPLDATYNDQIAEEFRFDWAMLALSMQSMKVDVGLVIDLTNTTRFYNKNDVEALNITHVKLQCRGHGVTPSKEQTEIFIRICKMFWDKNPDRKIGVHCTHGFNRSGFLISSFLVEVEDWSIEDAVELFAKCRPTGIYKQDYLQELCQRYGDPQNVMQAPELPEWCLEEDEASDNETDSGYSSTDRRRKRRRMNEAKFMEGVSDVSLVSSPRLEELQSLCQKMCKWEQNGFPGSQPVSMGQENIQNLNRMSYRVTWKADGVRYMMLILGKEQVYLIDRDNNVFEAPQLTFPQRKNINDHVYDTLLDGEMVLDKENGATHPRYLAYDIIKFQGQDVGQTIHDTRMHCIEKEIVGPRNEATRHGLLDKSKEPFSIRRKDFFPLEKAGWILDKFVQGVCHETDGLILNPNQEHYTPGQSPNVLKWKPHEMNSVDFQLKITTVRQEGCLPTKVGALFVGGYKPPLASIKITKELRQYDNKIIECTWSGTEWVFLRVREDKSFPNAYKTAMNVCNSIKNPVTKEGLLDYIDKHRYRRHGEGHSSSRPTSSRT